MSFTLDTSGAVIVPADTSAGRTAAWRCEWDNPHMTPFVQGYVEALFREAASTTPWPDRGCFRHPNKEVAPATCVEVGFRDLAPETLAAILKVEAWAAKNLGGLTADDGRRFWEHQQAGFPGPGPLDAELGERFSPLTPYLGDDGKVRLRATSETKGLEQQ